MLTRSLGVNGPTSSAIGLGCMGMSDFYGPSDRSESIATLRAALDANVTLLDTGDFYGMGHNEMLISEAIQNRPRDQIILSVKFGAQRDPGGNWVGIDGRPAAVKTALAYTLKRLGTDHIDIYRPARLDPNVPIEDTVGAIAEMVKAGHVRHVGLSEVGSKTIQRAASTHPICDLQIEYSILSRGIETSILPTCRALSIGITAYGVLSRGLIGSRWSKDKIAPDDYRKNLPRFQGENLEKNQKLLEPIRIIAAAKGVSLPQIAIAWVLSRGKDIVPIIGARRRQTLSESLAALDVILSPDELLAIEGALPNGTVAGSRYAEAQMAHLDSERG
jgi:pyridoxine 4-dehydrogenase